MTARRLPAGGRIDRARRLSFTWEGRALSGFAGDSAAAALLGAGVRIVGRSFKYHRPRGIWGAWAEEPNAILDAAWRNEHDPNARATTLELREGMALRAVNGEPSVERDMYAAFDLLNRFLPAGFYYKTFMTPDWHRYEPRIRALAGLGRMRTDPDTRRFDQRNAACDVLVVGAGPAGIAAARAAASAGLRVILADDRPVPGGALLAEGGVIDGADAADWAAMCVADLARRGVQVLPRTTVFGAYDENAFGLLERRAEAPEGWAPERVWMVRARRVVLAPGAIERPLTFPDNDRPGVMLASAALHYLRHHAILVGDAIVVATNNDSAYPAAQALQEAGAAVTVADVRPVLPTAAEALRARGARVLAGSVVLGTGGRGGVIWADLGPAAATARSDVTMRVPVSAVLSSGGWSPAVHLHSHGGGKLRWDTGALAFLPTTERTGQHHAGALAGATTTAAALTSGHAAGMAAAAALGARADADPPAAAAAPEPGLAAGEYWRVPLKRSRQWLDLQNDVTVKDVALAARENYVSVEHLKRYTTLGMATDQGKTSNVPGLAVLAAETGRAIPDVGTTTFRPPYVPVSLGALAGLRHGKLFAPWRRLPAHAEHAALGAEFREYGGWMRPAFYPRAGEHEEQAVGREAAAVRASLGVFDGSSLGKIIVRGPDAAAFLNLIFYNEVANLKPGRLRYVLLLRETGIVYDDGVVARVDAETYLLSPSSSHTAGVLAMLEAWRQTEYPQMRVAFHDVTAAWATIAVSGPQSRAALAGLTDIDLTPDALPHMAFATGTVGGVPGRIARVSFTGERSYEVSVPAGHGAALWRALLAAGAAFDAVPYGIEALSLLRAEKGYILIGVDTDGMTLPDDLGMSGPLRAKKLDFVGKRSLLTPDARRPDRRQFVGLASLTPDEVLPVGAHAVERDTTGKPRSIGWITTSRRSPSLGHAFALGMVERGRARAAEGAEVELFHRGRTLRARVCSPVFYDPAGERLNG